MSKWTAEEVRVVADAIEFRGDAFSPVAVDMLTAYANRIEADEVAMPDGYTALLSDGKRYWADKPGEYGDWKPYFLGRTTAQAAQMSLFTGTIGGVHVGLHGTRESVEALDTFLQSAEPVAHGETLVTRNPAPHAAAPSVPSSPTVTLRVGTNTHPNSPDAADGGRVDVEAVFDEVASWLPYDGDDNRIRERFSEARAAQGQGEAVAWIIDWPDEPELGHYFAEEEVKGARSRPLYTHPPASPAGVPDGIATDAARYRFLRDYSGMYVHFPNRRALLRESLDKAIDKARLAAAPSAHEGGEVGL